RFRLSAAWTERHVDDLLRRVRALLDELDGPPRWREEGGARAPAGDFEGRGIGDADWAPLVAIEDAADAPARRDSLAILQGIAAAGLGLVAVRVADGEVLGYAFCAPCEHFPGVAGPAFDPAFGAHESVFSADVTVTEAARGRGIGRALKRLQV